MKKMSNPIVSLCMPTNGVIEWVFPVLDSIYVQGCDCNDFEVVITDNGNNKEFKEKMEIYAQKHFNLHYFETEALPFINEIESYKRAEGELIKFVNHRTLLVESSLQKIIDYAKKNIDDKPITYFSNGVLEIEKRQNEYDSFNDFVKNLSFWSSWSTGMTIWKSDFQRLPGDISTFNELFPHMDVLFAERNRIRYVIDNTIIFNELPVNGIPKAKYDLFYAFAVEYVALILKLRLDGDITTETFLKVKRDNLLFLSKLYFDFVIKKESCSYDVSSLNNSIKIFYSKAELNKTFIKRMIKKIVR